MIAAPASQLTCGRCAAQIECCGFCDSPACSNPVCYRCTRIVLGQELPQSHPTEADAG